VSGRAVDPLARVALVVVDVQRGLEDPSWGPRDNPECEANIARLIAAWREAARPVVFVRHDSDEDVSPLRPDEPGNAFKDVITGEPDLLVAKRVNSAFYGDPDLHAWLQGRGLDGVVVCGITTNHCCETTARMAGNLGYRTWFAIDATHTFDRRALDGTTIPAAEIARVTAANLDGEFATVVQTARLLGASAPAAAGAPPATPTP
jgi:nicotinamidase-related amidase